MTAEQFQRTVREYYHRHRRDLPWRTPALKLRQDKTLDPYKILVSEVMLQQTQVNRVMPKYQAFITHFPTAKKLADAPLSEVLRQWNGLGYNRRAQYLHEAAKMLAAKHQPWSYQDLVSLKGIGPNTAPAVCVYAYNQSRVFIETNIRSVLIHHFFKDATHKLSDRELTTILAAVIDRPRAREFYWALMDYGAYIKKATGSQLSQVKAYNKQSRFEGSVRQLRGQLIRLLLDHPVSFKQLANKLPDQRLETILQTLTHEGLVVQQAGKYQIG